MKICPKCQKTYSDESLNFCLEDGTVLDRVNFESDAPLPETVLISQPRQTASNQVFDGQISPSNWNPMPQAQTAPRKNSKNWLVIGGILGVLALICGSGFLGFIALVAGLDEEFEQNTNYQTNIANVRRSDTKPDASKNVTRVDFSKWNQNNTKFGNTDYRSGELIMNSNDNNFYYVLVAPSNLKTENVTTKVTVRNIESGDNSLGYGLIVHSNPVPLQKDYGFLVNSATRSYRIVKHKPKKEENVVSWTKSAAVKSGSQENVLEVQDESGSMKFFINGDFITSVPNNDGFKGGVAGIYVGGKSPIGFSNLEIRE